MLYLRQPGYGSCYITGKMLTDELITEYAHQQDLAGLCTMEEQINLEIPPASSPAHLDRLFKELELVQGGKSTNLATGLHELQPDEPQAFLLETLN